MVCFPKDYWFNSSKGLFRVRIIPNDVLLEFNPETFVSVQKLWSVNPIYEKARTNDEKERIKAKHLIEYAEMINKLNSHTNVSEQDDYIVKEMQSQGYTRAKR